MKHIRDLIKNSKEKFNKTIALQILRDKDYYKLSYADLYDYAEKLGSFFVKKGIKRGDRIGILGNNSPEWAITFFACQMYGIIAVPVDRMLKTNEIKHIIDNSGMRILVAEDKFLEKIMEIKDELPMLEATYSLTVGNEENIYSLLKGVDEIFPWEEFSEDEPAVFLYTSGTTGKTKGVILTNKNIVADIKGINKALELRENDVMLSILPLHHAYELTAGFLAALSNGVTITISPSLAQRDIIRAMKETKVTKMIGVPLIFEKFYDGILKNIEKLPKTKKTIIKGLLKAGKLKRKFDKSLNGTKSLFMPILKKAGFDNIIFFVAGGAALPPHVNEFFYILGIPILQGYGLTETSPVISVVLPDNVDFFSVGPPLEGVKVRIYNPDENGVGEIVVRGDTVMKGYYKEPEKSAEVLKRGWFYTGDFGLLDEEGRIHIKGRLKNVIVSKGGKNIYPEEIEEIMLQSPFIEEILVVGKDTPQAIVYPNFENIDAYFSENGVENPDEDDVFELIKSEIESGNKKLAKYKQVRDVMIRDEEFPKTSTRKIKRYLFMGKKGAV